MSYVKMENIYRNTRYEMFAMAVADIIDVGARNIQEMADSEIESMPGNGLMTKDFVVALRKLSKEICYAMDGVVELVQFCEAKSVFDLEYYVPHKRIPYDRLTEIATQAIHGLHGYYGDWDEELEDADLELDDDEKEFFGVPINEEEEEDYE